MKPRLIIEQKITAFVNRYTVFAADEAGTRTEQRAFAQQKRVALKEKVWFYGDEKKSAELFSFRAEKVFDIHGRYMVEDETGRLIGMFRKEFKQSLLASTWVVMDAAGNDRFKVAESSTALALFRRYGGWIPVVGEIIELVTQFLRYHFVFTPTGSDEVVGTYRKTTLFRDHYHLSLTDEAYAACDWRLFAAMGVALDALQSR